VAYDFAYNSVSYDPTTGTYGFDYSGVSFEFSSGIFVTGGGGYTYQLRWASNAISVNIDGLTAPEQQLAIAALAQWASVAPLTFTFTGGAADITYVDSGADSIATTTDTFPQSDQNLLLVPHSDQSLQAATVDISTTFFANDGGAMDGRTGFGSNDFQTYLALTGRALGVGSQVTYSLWGTQNPDGTISFPPPTETNTLAGDSLQYSVMSTASQANSGGSQYNYVVSLQRDDINAIQSLYGRAITQPGDTVYGFHSTAGAIYDFASYAGFAAPLFTIYDSGGNNALDASGYAMDQVIDLETGTWSSIGGSVNNIFIYGYPQYPLDQSNTQIQNAVGGSGNDLIIANPTANGTLTGGGGNDIFEGTFAGLSGTTITDMNAGDRIRFIDTTAFNGFGFERTGTTLTYANTDGLHALTLSNSAPGHFVPIPFQADDQHGHSGTAIDLKLTNPTSTSDFADTGISDVLWRGSDGSIDIWSMDQGSIVSSTTLQYTAGPSWSVAAIADFNGDGHSDILWRNADGTLIDWAMNSSFIWSNQTLGQVDPSWSIIGAADFDGNGHADLLWRNANGALSMWFMNGPGVVDKEAINATPDASWSVAGVGDYNGDGKSDILWRDTDGRLAVWSMNGTAITSQTLSAAPDASWSVAGIGDFNGDGNADILWRNGDGSLVEWLMNGSQITASQPIAASPDASWSIAQIGDFNGDGKSDLLWRQSGSGTLAEWTMNGSDIASSQTIAAAPDSSWQVQSKPTNYAV
jgi:serralysin